MPNAGGFSRGPCQNDTGFMDKKTIAFTDEELIQAICGNDHYRHQQAFRFITRDSGWWHIAKRKIARSGGNGHEADLAVSEALAPFWMTIKERRFRADSTLRTFYVAIAYRRWQANTSRNYNWRTWFVVNWFGIEPPDPGLADHGLFDADKKRVARALLDLLTEEERLLLQAWAAGLTPGEIAKAFGIANAEAARNRTLRARKKLSRLLTESGRFERMRDFVQKIDRVYSF